MPLGSAGSAEKLLQNSGIWGWREIGGGARKVSNRKISKNNIKSPLFSTCSLVEQLGGRRNGRRWEGLGGFRVLVVGKENKYISSGREAFWRRQKLGVKGATQFPITNLLKFYSISGLGISCPEPGPGRFALLLEPVNPNAGFLTFPLLLLSFSSLPLVLELSSGRKFILAVARKGTRRPLISTSFTSPRGTSGKSLGWG